MGPQTDLSLPGIKTGWNVSIHNGLGNNNDVLKGLGGNDAGNFGGFGLGGSYSKSLIGNSNRFDPNGVQTLSLNIGPIFGLGQTKSTTWSGKFSDLLK